MKIGIDCRLWNETGVGRYIRNLVEQLLVIDKKNTYVLFVLSKDYEEIRSQLSTFNSQLIKVDIRWHSVEEQVKFPHILEKEKLDLMHFPYFSVPIRYKGQFVITIHDLILHHFGTGKASTLPLPLYRLKHAGYTYVLSQAVKKAKKIIVPLETVKYDVLDTFKVDKEKVVVTKEGVDDALYSSSERKRIEKLKEFSSRLRSNNNYFLYVGNAYPHKNLERLLQAYSQMVSNKDRMDSNRFSSLSGIKLMLVGKNDFFYKRLRRKVEEMGLEDTIIFNHDVSDETLASLYAHAKAFISPSLMEGFGLPPLEAMALSCPVLLSDIPAFREVCGSAGFYFNPYSVAAIKEKMEYIAGITEKTRKEHVDRGLERVKEFSWKEMAERTLEIYSSLMVSNNNRIDSNKKHE